MGKTIWMFWLTLIVLVLSVLGGGAQNTVVSIDRQAPDVDTPIVPDKRPLTGAQNLTLGVSAKDRSSLLTSMSFATQLDKNPPASGYNSITSVSYVLGRLNVHHLSGRSQLFLDYVGGAAFSRSGTSTNSSIQDLGVCESLDLGRWSLLLADQVSYLTESPFGFGGVGGLGFLGNVSRSGPGGTFGTVPCSLQTVLIPSQTVPTTGVPRLSNTVVGQAEYRFNRNSSWTAAGSYGLLRFSNAGYTNGSDALFQTGYNHQINRASTIAVLYRFDALRFAHLSQGIDDHVMQFSYARRMTGQMSFQVAAGPDLQVFQTPSSGSSSRVSWNLQSRFNYQARSTSLEASYDHFVNSGSGVLIGSEVDQLQQTLGHNLTRSWQGSVSLGYASSRSLLQTSPNAGAVRFGSWYGSVRSNHRLGQGIDLFLAYGARLQGTNTAVCAVSLTCRTNFISHEISLGFNWGLRPIALP